MVIEIGFDIPDDDREQHLKAIEAALETCSDHWKGYYIEPPSPYDTLDDLEAACEGK